MEPDFVATELLKELKYGNEQKRKRIKHLQVALIVMTLVTCVTLLSLVSMLIWY